MTPVLLSSVLLLATALAAQDEPALVAPIVITYAPDGLQLTPALVNGLLAGTVGRRVNGKQRESNPDWPPLALRVEQDDADARQPSGYFTARLVVAGTSQQRSGEGELLRAIVAALEQELNARMHDAPREALDARLAPARDALTETERRLTDMRQALAQLREGDGRDDGVDDLRRTLQDLELQLRSDEPLVAVGSKQAADLEDRLRREVLDRAVLESKAADLEVRLEGETESSDKGDLRRNLIDLIATREHKARLIDQLSSQASSTSSAVQERTNRLLEIRVRIEGLREQLEAAGKERDVTRKRDAERAALEMEMATLDGRVGPLRDRVAELTRCAEGLVPVRVQLWR